MNISNYQNNADDMSTLNRKQRRMLKACTRKNKPFSTEKTKPYGRKTGKGWGFVQVETLGLGEVE